MLCPSKIVTPYLFFLLLSFNSLIHSAITTTPTSGCGLPIPTEVTAGGPSYNFTHFLSSSTSPPSYRAYRLTVPKDYDINIPAPLIVSFHGRQRSNLEQLQESKFSNPFFKTKAIVVYPQGIDVTHPLSPLPSTLLVLAPKLTLSPSANGSATLPPPRP